MSSTILTFRKNFPGSNPVLLGVLAISLLIILFFRYGFLLEGVLITSPVIGFFWFGIAIYILWVKGLLKGPWMLLVGVFGFKALSWLLLLWQYWPDVILGSLSWPFSSSALYSLEALGSMLAAAFLIQMISGEEKHLFRHGLMADSSLLILAVFLLVGLHFYDEIRALWLATSWQNMFVRLQLIPVIYSGGLAAIVLFIVKSKLEGRLIYLIAAIPFSIHISIEAFFSIKTPNPLHFDELSVTSAIIYDTSAILMLIYLTLAKEPRALPVNTIKEAYFRVSPLVWFSSLTLIAIQAYLVLNHERLPGASGQELALVFMVFIASIALVVRLFILVFHAKDQQRWLEHEVITDGLTGLLNRKGFVRQFHQIRAQQPLPSYLFCVLDVDSFKLINDTYGHKVGDIVLVGISARLKVFGGMLLAGRLGGDEFVVIINKQNKQALEVLKQLHTTLSGQYSISEGNESKSGKYVNNSVSIGAVETWGDNHSFDDLYAMADRSLYHAKRCYSQFELAQFSLYSRISAERSLLRILQENDYDEYLVLYFQPIVDTLTQKAQGHEVLMRLRDHEGHIFEPFEFIDLATSSGKLWALTKALMTKINDAFSEQAPHGFLSINLPPDFLERVRLRDDLLALLSASPVPISYWLLEITEHSETDMQSLQEGIHLFGQAGYRFALDDFGAGGASLSRLAQLQVDIVKLDASILRAAERGRTEFLDSIVALSHRLRLQVVAEGIETERQLDIIQHAEVDMVQGYLTGRPLPKYPF